MNKYGDLKIWKGAMELVREVYVSMTKLPDDEKFGLISHSKRCSESIPTNIAEGGGRNSKKKFNPFLSITNGSTSERETQLLLIYQLKFVDRQNIEPLLEKCAEISKMQKA